SKTESGVQPDRRQRLAAADHGDHLAITELFTARQHRAQKRPADTAADRVGIDIDRILKREAITHARPEWPSIAIAQHSAARFCYEVRQTARHDVSAQPRLLFLFRRDLLVRSQPVMDMMSVDRSDRGDVIVTRRPDDQ